MRYPCNMENLGTLDLITLSNSGGDSRVSIAPGRGALVTSFAVGNRELLYLDESTFRDPTKNVRGGIPVLFPAPGKLANDVWSYRGRRGAMKQHGFARTEAWTVTSRTSHSLTCSLDSNEQTLAQYPWRFHAELEFALQGSRLRIVFRLLNTDTETLPFGVGYHPYFQVADKTRARVATDATQAFDNTQKQTRAFSGFDFTQPEVDVHLLDHSAKQCTLALVDGANITLRTSDHFSLWVVWTLAGKDFICLEPWTSPGNAINSGERLLTLAPGQRHESWVEIEIIG